MALSKPVASELLEAFRAGRAGLGRESVRLVMQEQIETEATEVVGPARYERSDARTTQRNGAWPRLVATQAGDVELRIPKLRQGSFFPVIVQRRRIDQGPVCGGDEAWSSLPAHLRAARLSLDPDQPAGVRSRVPAAKEKRNGIFLVAPRNPLRCHVGVDSVLLGNLAKSHHSCGQIPPMVVVLLRLSILTPSHLARAKRESVASNESAHGRIVYQEVNMAWVTGTLSQNGNSRFTWNVSGAALNTFDTVEVGIVSGSTPITIVEHLVRPGPVHSITVDTRGGAAAGYIIRGGLVP